jgi:nitronate monooxygenase
MGLYPDQFIARIKSKAIKWFATAATVSEAKAAESAGADIIVAQGMEAGGHRGAFDATKAETRMIGLFSLLPAIVDAVKVPVVASGGIADGRGVAAALLLGASAVQVGTAFLRCPEAKIPSAWSDAIGRAAPEDTMVTRAFSGRSGRSLATAPPPAPYPVQPGLTQAMRDAGVKQNTIEQIQAWAGQSSGLATTDPAGEVVRRLWDKAQALLR